MRITIQGAFGGVLLGLVVASVSLVARGQSPPAFDERCILVSCVAPRSHTGGILSRRALPARRLARLGATADFHHGLLVSRSLT